MNSLLIAQNIVKRALRSKKELISLLLLPVLAIGIMTAAVGKGAEQSTAVGIVIEDSGNLGKELLSRLEDPSLNFVNLTSAKYRSAVANNQVKFVLLVPYGFTADLSAGKRVAVTFYGSETSSVYQQLKAKVNQYILAVYTAQSLADEQKKLDANTFLQTANQNGLTITRQEAAGGPALDQALVTSIGFCLVFIMLLVMVTIGTILEDKQKLTLARMFVSPLQEWEIAAGNLLGSLGLGVMQLIPIELTLSYIYHLSWKSGLELFIALFCFLIAAIGLGIGLSGIIKQNFNPTIIIATIIVPTSILGGVFIPETNLPSVMAKLGYAVPQKWVLDAIRQIMQGSGLNLLDLGINLLFGLAFATFGAKTLKPLST